MINVKHMWHKLIFMRKISKLVDENDKKVKFIIQNFCEENNYDYTRWQLHLIQTTTFKDKIRINITLGRPGLLIGKGGRTINALTESLNKKLDKPTQIEIVEFNVWK